MNVMVTGFPRSGTTFVGRTISAGRGFSYVHEPFNSKWPALGTKFRAFPFWRPDEESKDDMALLCKLQSVFGFIPSIPDIRHADWSRPVFSLKRMARTVFPPCGPIFKPHVVLKDPLAVCATDILIRRFDMKAIVMFRDPVEIAASIHKYGWRLNPERFTGQATMAAWMDDETQREMDTLDPDDRSSHVLLTAHAWNLVHRLLASKTRSSETVMYVRHSDLIKSPKEVIGRILEWLGIADDPARRKFVEDHCRREEIKGQSETPDILDVRRNLSKGTRVSEKILRSDEIAGIRSITGDIESHFSKLMDPS